MQETTTRPAGFVRPRFDDGTFDEPLPLEEHVLERVVHGSTRARLVIEGPRGSGLTTTIRWLAARIAERGVAVVGPGPIGVSGDVACRALDRGEAVLLLDLSVGRFAPDAWFNAEALLRDACNRRWRAVAVAAALPGWRGYALDVVKLAPWSRDDLIDALGAPRFVDRRGALLGAVQALPDPERLLARPRTALWVLDAALALGPEEPVTLARIYANVLDTLSPSTLHLLRRCEPGGALTTHALATALEALPLDVDVDEEQLLALFEVTGHLAPCMVGQRQPELLQRVATTARILHLGEPRLVLPGLQHMLQAGECLASIARGDPPPREVPPAWFPFLRELIDDAHRARLRSWLTEPAPVPAHPHEGAAATLLWVAGEAPPLDGARRPACLAHAWLEGVELAGADLTRAFVGQSRLSRARLQGARLTQANLVDVTLDRAALDGADLSRAKLERVSLDGASLRGASAEQTTLSGCQLRGACLEGARLEGATLGGCHLDGAGLRRAVLRRALLAATSLAGADLAQVDLDCALLTDLDLTRTLCFEPTSLGRASLARCALSGVDLTGVPAEVARFEACELTATTLAGAFLVGAAFVRCRAHEARFDGADLQGAVFDKVDFHAGSSRSGLLVGKPALEGSMTGFYVEGTTDEAWASPESIRQASFRGADLRGARFVRTNLSRVDLRGARLDADLRAQACEQGAILDAR